MELLDLIDRLEEIVETGTRVPWTGKSLVDAETVAELIDRIRAAVPAEVQEAQEIRTRGEAIVSEAVLAAKKIRSKAEIDHKTRVDENSIVQEAQAQANEIKAQAEQEAEQVRQGAEREAVARRQEADAYAEQSLAKLRDHVNSLKEQVTVLREQADAQVNTLEAQVSQLQHSVESGMKYLQARWDKMPVAAGNGAHNGNGHKLPSR